MAAAHFSEMRGGTQQRLAFSSCSLAQVKTLEKLGCKTFIELGASARLSSFFFIDLIKNDKWKRAADVEFLVSDVQPGPKPVQCQLDYSLHILSVFCTKIESSQWRAIENESLTFIIRPTLALSGNLFDQNGLNHK